MLKSLIIAFSTYSRFPMPQVEWEEKSMRYCMCFFPLVGAAIGLCSVACFWLLGWLGAGKELTAALLTALPILLNGGIHMDGFLDTMDAKSSWKPAEEKLKILKDPHTGAFAVLYGILYLLVSYGLFCEVTAAQIGCVAAGYALSRSFSGLSVVTFRKAKKDGMVAASADAAAGRVKWILAVQILLFSALLLVISPVGGVLCIAAAGLAFWHYRRMAYRVFGGVTGDLAGYFLQICELWMLLFLVVGEKLLLPALLAAI